MISIQELKNQGYKMFMDSFKIHKEMSQDAYKGTWQKCIRDQNGKKYFVNIEHWDFKNSDLGSRYPDSNPTFQADSQMNSPEGTFNIALLSCGDKTLSFVESWFEKQWAGNGCFYYEKND